MSRSHFSKASAESSSSVSPSTSTVFANAWIASSGIGAGLPSTQSLSASAFIPHTGYVTHVTALLVRRVYGAFDPTPRHGLEEKVMFGGLATGFVHLVKPSKHAQGIATDKRPIRR